MALYETFALRTSLSAIDPEKTGISRNLYTKMYTKRLNFNKSRRFLFKSKKFSKL